MSDERYAEFLVLTIDAKGYVSLIIYMPLKYRLHCRMASPFQDVSHSKKQGVFPTIRG